MARKVGKFAAWTDKAKGEFVKDHFFVTRPFDTNEVREVARLLRREYVRWPWNTYAILWTETETFMDDVCRRAHVKRMNSFDVYDAFLRAAGFSYDAIHTGRFVLVSPRRRKRLLELSAVQINLLSELMEVIGWVCFRERKRVAEEMIREEMRRQDARTVRGIALRELVAQRETPAGISVSQVVVTQGPEVDLHLTQDNWAIFTDQEFNRLVNHENALVTEQIHEALETVAHEVQLRLAHITQVSRGASILERMFEDVLRDVAVDFCRAHERSGHFCRQIIESLTGIHWRRRQVREKRNFFRTRSLEWNIAERTFRVEFTIS